MGEKKIKIAVVFGTRPEIIKLAPVILELRRFPNVFELTIISSGQHREMLEQFFSFFNIKPDYELAVMSVNQDLFDINKKILAKIKKVLRYKKPDLIIVQGDTLTAFTAAVSAFYLKIPVAHVEAGLRTFDKYSPYPEEMSRQLIDVLSDIYFVPTSQSKKNLLREGKVEAKIFVTGNTSIDAVATSLNLKKTFVNKKLKKIDFKNKKVVLITCHRRESWGKKMSEIFLAIRDLADYFEDIEIVFPVHLNPAIRRKVEKFLSQHSRVHILPPLGYSDMVNLMRKSFFIGTDSGGLQEEAPYLNKPVVVLRDKTERVEGLKAGTLLIGGTSRKKVFNTLKRLVKDQILYKKMATAKNPYGDGKASIRIRKAITQYFRV